MKKLLLLIPALLVLFLLWNRAPSPDVALRPHAADAQKLPVRRIVDAITRQPLAEARLHAVRLGTPGAMAWDATGQTGTEGRFEIEGPGPWLVHVRHPGYAPFTGEWSGNDIELTPLASIRGCVLDEEDRPISGARIDFRFPMALRVDNPALPDELLAVRDRPIETDAEGFFQVDHLLPGLSYSARIAPDGWCPVTTKKILPSPGQTYSFTARLGRSATLSGRALLFDGSIAPGAVVTIYGHTRDGGMMNEATVLSGPDGSFSATLSPGEKWMEASSRREGIEWYGGMRCETGIATVLELGRGSVVRGEVVDSKGAPVGGAKVWLIARRPDEARSIELVASKEGRFEVRGLVGESLEYSVTHGDRSANGIVPEIPARLELRLE